MRGRRAGSSMPFLEIELPGAVLLRQQAPLQPVREPADDALKVRQLLVEIGAQPRQFVGIAQFLGMDDLVELRREGACSPGRAARWRARPADATTSDASSASPRRRRPAARRRAHRRPPCAPSSRSSSASSVISTSARSPSDCSLGVALGLVLVLELVAVLVLVLVSWSSGGSSVMSSEERRSRTERRKSALVFDCAEKPVEVAPGALLDEISPEFDDFAAAGGGLCRSGARAP